MEEFSIEDLYKIICSQRVLADSDTTYMVLDKNLHVFFVNDEVVPSEKHLCPGDIIECINALNSPGGCGTHSDCQFCKLRKSLLESFASEKKTEVDISLLLKGNVEFDAHVSTTPFYHKGKKYAVVVINNSTAKHREMMMERVFFHDMLNLAGALQGFLDCTNSENAQETLDLVKGLSKQIIDEVNSQRDLIYAQKGILKTNNTSFPASKVLNYTFETLLPMVQEHGKTMILDNQLGEQTLQSDFNLIHRILLNMIKNASEDDCPNEEISLKAYEKDGNIVFSVHNHSAIPEEFRPEIFKYGKTLKKTGHGIGTYSIKLLGENYLGGKVWFTSSEEEGTEFFLSLPKA